MEVGLFNLETEVGNLKGKDQSTIHSADCQSDLTIQKKHQSNGPPDHCAAAWLHLCGNKPRTYPRTMDESPSDHS
jgi:hypothetical protein